MFEMLPPALVMVFGALLIGLARSHVRTLFILGTPLLTLWAIWSR